MPAGSKQRIEDVARDLMSRRGYNGMGLKAVSDAAELPYGSIYHHFPGGKEQIAAAAIAATGEVLGELLRALFTTTPPDQAVQAMFDFMVGRLEQSDWSEGCAIGTPALDGTDESADVRLACVAAFGHMVDPIAEGLVTAGMGDDDAHDLATTILAAYEGATMMARVQRSAAPLRATAKAMISLLPTA